MSTNTMALIASVWVVLTYAQMVRTDNPRPFNLANALLWPIILVPSVASGAWGPALLTVVFGAVGLYGTIQDNWADDVEETM